MERKAETKANHDAEEDVVNIEAKGSRISSHLPTFRQPSEQYSRDGLKLRKLKYSK